MKRLLKKRTVILSEEKLKFINDWALLAAEHFKDHKHIRTKEQRIDNIIIGKIAEEVVYEIFSPIYNVTSVSYIINEDGKGDGGIDLWIAGKSWDIKCVNQDFKTERPVAQSVSDYYAFVRVNKESTGGTYIGALNKEGLFKFAKERNNEGVNYKYVLDYVFEKNVNFDDIEF